MKKLSIVIVLFIAVTSLFGQTVRPQKLKLPILDNGEIMTGPFNAPCVANNTLNFSTGQSSGLMVLLPGQADPFWGPIAYVIPPANANWNKVTGAAILGPNTSNNAVGVKKFIRRFYVCKEDSVKFSGTFRDDNKLTSFKLYKGTPGSGTPILVWTFSVPSVGGIDPQCWKDIPYAGSASLTGGDYYFEFEYDNYGSFGGFALAGTMTTSSNVLSNSKDCCCDCSTLQDKPTINGPTCFCRPEKCDTTLRYSVASNPCYKYTWNVRPKLAFTGQGTAQIALNCKDLLQSKYTILVTIRCGNKIVTNTIPLTVCSKADPSFNMSTSGSSATFTSNAPGSTNYWILNNDLDNSCNYTSGDNTEPLITGTTANYSSLVNNRQYSMGHIVYNDCKNGCACWSYQIMCFKWLPSFQMKTKGGIKSMEIISEKQYDNFDDLPEEIRKKLPLGANTEQK